MVETPTFSQSLYKYKYSLTTEGNVVLTPESGESDIIISSSGDVTVALDGTF